MATVDGSMIHGISIHALREEGDLTPASKSSWTIYFYPRPPRGGRLVVPVHGKVLCQFLSTPSARRATRVRGAVCKYGRHFYPRPPRGGRQFNISYKNVWTKISIHALREEGDLSVALQPGCPILFLSTPSARRATSTWDAAGIVLVISIHALREEGDQAQLVNGVQQTVFLSTPSARRAT